MSGILCRVAGLAFAATMLPARADEPPSPGPRPAEIDCTITGQSIGPLRLGMSLAQAREAWPAAVFKRDSGLDDIVVLLVEVQGQVLAVSEVGYDLPPGPLPAATQLLDLSTYHPWCRDARDVGPGTLLSTAARSYGGLEEIVRSDVEQREYARFRQEPASMHFRVDYKSIFSAPTQRRTTSYQPDARVLGVELWLDSR